jgi:hypothetical protein
VGDTTRINNNKIGFRGRYSDMKPELFEEFSNLLAFILIHFTTKSPDRKCSHDVIYCMIVGTD